MELEGRLVHNIGTYIKLTGLKPFWLRPSPAAPFVFLDLLLLRYPSRSSSKSPVIKSASVRRTPAPLFCRDLRPQPLFRRLCGTCCCTPAICFQPTSSRVSPPAAYSDFRWQPRLLRRRSLRPQPLLRRAPTGSPRVLRFLPPATTEGGCLISFLCTG